MALSSDAIFLITFIANFVIAYYGFALYTQVNGSSLAKVALFATLSTIVFGFHHLGEALFGESPLGLLLAESVESAAAFLLLASVYYIYKISNEIFIADPPAPKGKK